MKALRWWSVALVLAVGLGWNLSVRAAVVKNVQTGMAFMSGASTAVSVTIPSAVNPARAFVICDFLVGNNNSPAASQRVTCELTGATTLTITNGAADDQEVVRWYVVEFFSGVTVQRGLVPTTTYTAVTPTVDVPIAAVNLAKTFVLISARTASIATNMDEQFTPTAQLTSNINLRLTRNDTGTDDLAVAWQVVQIESAVVQSGITTIAQAATSVTAALNPGVDTTRTFLVFTSNGGAAVNGVESRYLTRGEITNATTLTFTRALNQNVANGQVNIAWFAVRMTDGTIVQSGTNTTPDPNTTTMNAPLSTPVVINRSVPFISVSGDPTSTADDALDDNSWVADTFAVNNLQLTNSTNAQNNVNTTVAWQVVQFANAPNRVDGPAGGGRSGGREVFP
jgi:hypothetical protein